jgi:peptidoglycan/LPS O-acetylase OafA/YrhL
MTTTTTSTPTTTESRYGDVIALVLVAAFTLSVAHTVYAAVQGLEDPDFTLTTPLTWIFYGVGFGMAALARREAAWAQRVVLAFLVLVIAIGLFYYPTTFTGDKQTTFGWFENDVYMGLLIVAFFLSVLRVRRRSLVP